MDRTERFYKIDRLLKQNSVVPLTKFTEELEVSRATFKRDIEYMRSRLHAPIVWDRERNGYWLNAAEPDANRYELPGIWFNASEVYALLTMEHLLGQMEPGILAPRVAPLRARLAQLLGSTDHSLEEVRRRIRILPMANRQVSGTDFELIAHGLLRRRRLRFAYHARTTDETTSRLVSPQRLVHYRDNWYLDAWCHERDALRSFSVDRIKNAEIQVEVALDVPEAELDETLGSGYGIFAGRDVRWATIRFSAKAARWVGNETWHPNQRARFDEAGCYILEVPYADDRELLLDILRHGSDVEVLAPDHLRAKIRDSLRQASQLYE